MGMGKKHIVRRAFDDRKPGDEYIPNGDKNEKTIIEFFCRTEDVQENTCEKCGRSFEKPQGLAGHKRHCKGE